MFRSRRVYSSFNCRRFVWLHWTTTARRTRTHDEVIIQLTRHDRFFIESSSDDEDLSPPPSRQVSRLSNSSAKYFDYYDTHHSVFSRNSYYHDMHDIHPWSRRPCSRHSGIPFATLRATSCSPRLDELCRPKIKRERLIRQGKRWWTRRTSSIHLESLSFRILW